MNLQDQNEFDEDVIEINHEESKRRIIKILKMAGVHKEYETSEEKAQRRAEKAFRIFGE